MQQSCYHCGTKNPSAAYSSVVLNEMRFFCCPGCQAVAEAIVSNGLENYYSFRSELADKVSDKNNDILESLQLFDEDNITEEFVYQSGENREIQLSIAGINCAACGWLLEKQLSKLGGIRSVGANVTTKRLIVIWDDKALKLSQILQKIQQIGYLAKPFQEEQHEALHQQENKLLLKRLGLAGLMTMQVMMLNLGVFFDLFGQIDAQTKQYFNWVSLVLSTPVALYSAIGFYLSAWRALKARSVNMDVPISFALISIYVSGLYATTTAQGQTYFESLCMFVFLLLISRFLEQNARFKAAQISSNLFSHMPTTATLINEDNSHQSVLAKHLKIGQLVLVKVGEIIPVDGIVRQGNGQVNESMLTGEFQLITKQQDDKVYAGTINEVGTLVIEVLNALHHSVANQINQLQNRALLSKPRLANFADRTAHQFVMFVLIIAGLTYATWLFIAPDLAFWVMISVLIATCPCALGLATPVSLTCTVGYLNKRGVLLKRADVLEQLTQVDWVGLDKTGTLTEGKFIIKQLTNFSDLNEQEILKLASSLEQYSSHPIAAVFKEFSASDIVKDAQETIANGVSGEINGKTYRIGSARFCQVTSKDELASFNVFLTCGDTLLAAFLLADAIRPESARLINSLAPKYVSLLSGDNEPAVEKLAQELNIKHYHAHLEPAQKLSIIQQAQHQGHTVLMIGDGINDAPVLAQADVSITLGLSTDLAKSSADIILLDNALDKIPVIIQQAIRTQRNIKQNIAWATAYNLLILPLAVTGSLSPLIAVIGMSVSSLIVVANATRLLR
ncbi:MAG: heavy metal translocating P-type ATPase [Paraglaciecola sp.]|uniref:heavy metal translocating P-type ATPase n=1 Tax=Paraglaciecola sp. TaxID=1920173 RepID=UPI00273F7325|nr:heavy metal translocating P-type ATPase [Paraglaciecola sp.]MDP5029443.1 heavy metal translocating P-type ATPase [Paraglaciecola sp.]MDP5133030.1 heavy metal translocating P-type ATPase [Paraglaciecola sp.]